jgi:ribonuclease R
MRPSRDRVLRLLERSERTAMAGHEIARALRLGPAGPRMIASLLREMEREGRIERSAGGWRLAEQGGLTRAICRRESDGALVAIDENGEAWRLDAGAALEGEQILVETFAESGRAEVARAIGGARREWVGILSRRGREWLLTPYRDEAKWELRVPRAALRGGRPGDVVVAIAGGGRPAPRRRSRPAAPAPAKIVEVLGPPGTPDADFRAIVWRHRLPLHFPAPVVAEAESCGHDLDPAELARRRDLRELPFVTIDPATARDHDDAVCVEPAGRGRTRLWVAIADVSHFVAEDGALDREARRRGNSVYFPDRAIPMLPERLSSDVCSLRPDVDRLVLAVELEFDAGGVQRVARFHEAVIRSRARLVYDDAAAVMEGGANPRVPAGEVTRQLLQLAQLAARLGAKRRDAGAIDLDLPSAEIVLGDAGHPTDILEAPRTVAHRSIEEAMLAANRAVAEFLSAREVPALYRVHESPTPSALVDLRALLESFGLLDDLPRGAKLGAGEIAAAVQRALGRPEERLVHTTALRSMRPARYDPRCLGHFALAFDAYLHFTSPIRRYADLVAHRALRDAIANTAGAKRRAQARDARLAVWAERTSLCERTAMAAEREAVDLAKCVFMKPRVGERFDATVTRVARHGFYATLDPFFVEGLVLARDLRGHFELDERAVALVSRDGERFALGDRVRVRVSQVDLVRGWIDFALEHRLDRPRRRARAATA